MTRDKAIKLAIEAIEGEIKRLNVDANLYQLADARYPAAIRAFKRRNDLHQAIDVLKSPIAIQMDLFES